MKNYRFTAQEINQMKDFILTSIKTETEKRTAWRARLVYEMEAQCSSTKKSRTRGERMLALYEQLTINDLPNWLPTDHTPDQPKAAPTDLQFHCLTEGDSYNLYEICVKNEWTTCESYDEWLDAGGDWDIFEGDPDMIKINGAVNYFIKIDNRIFYTSERDNEEGMIEGILRSFYSNGSVHHFGYYTKFISNRPVNESIQNWKAWDAMENGIAYRGGAGYTYMIQHLRDPYGNRPAKHAA